MVSYNGFMAGKDDLVEVVSKTEEKKVPFSPENELCKKMTGISFEEDPKNVVFKMVGDREVISKKYGVPVSEDYKDKREYARQLLAIAKSKNIPVSLVDKSKLDREHLGAGITGKGKIVAPDIDLDSCTEAEAYGWAVKFGHELTHAVQSISDPNISIEQSEYEAYVLTYLPVAWGNSVKEYPGTETVQHYMAAFHMFEYIKQSCLDHYEKLGVSQETIPWMTDKEMIDDGKI